MFEGNKTSNVYELIFKSNTITTKTRGNYVFQQLVDILLNIHEFLLMFPFIEKDPESLYEGFPLSLDF